MYDFEGNKAFVRTLIIVNTGIHKHRVASEHIEEDKNFSENFSVIVTDMQTLPKRGEIRFKRKGASLDRSLGKESEPNNDFVELNGV